MHTGPGGPFHSIVSKISRNGDRRRCVQTVSCLRFDPVGVTSTVLGLLRKQYCAEEREKRTRCRCRHCCNLKHTVSCFRSDHTTLRTYTDVSGSCSHSIDQPQSSNFEGQLHQALSSLFQVYANLIINSPSQCSDIADVSRSLFNQWISHVFFPPLQALSLSSMTGASTHQHVLLKGLNTAGFPPFESQIMPLQAASVIVAL